MSKFSTVEQIQSALQLHRSGRLAEAVREYSNIIQSLDGHNEHSDTIAMLQSNLAAIYMSQADYPTALHHFDIAVKLAPENEKYRYNIAVLLTTKLNQHRQALLHCMRAIKLNSNKVEFYHLLGNIMQSMGRTEDAEKYFTIAENLALDQQQQQQQQSQPTESPVASPTDDESLMSYLPLLRLEIGMTHEVELDKRVYTVKCLSHNPHIYEIDGLLSSTECENIQKKAKKSNMQYSHIMGTGIHSDKPYRSSYNTWLPYAQDNELQQLQQRISVILGIPLDYLQHHSEELQVVKYDQGGEFKIHQDSSNFHSRLLTVLMYLTSSPSGSGGTWFPYAGSSKTAPATVEEAIVESLESFEQCTIDSSSLEGYTAMPVQGKAVVFFNYKSPALREIDVAAVHAGLPVEGDEEKWIANYWLSNKRELLIESLKRQ